MVSKNPKFGISEAENSHLEKYGYVIAEDEKDPYGQILISNFNYITISADARGGSVIEFLDGDCAGGDKFYITDPPNDIVREINSGNVYTTEYADDWVVLAPPPEPMGF